ncbi:hypothetical protein ACTXGU_00235 [Niallia sp. 01092]|uniref:hypothetical protein n=1 Tax=Niallia sp. 01092 TaxID=3457759 RepID=UPI003FD07F32
MSKRTIIINQNHKFLKKLQVDEETVLTIGNFKMKVSEFTEIHSHEKEPDDIMSIPAQVSTLDIKL